MIATEQAPTKVASDSNRVVWSSYDPATGDYALLSRDGGGAATRLPVASRKAPFDVDLGYLEEGVEVAVYSRCAQEPQLSGGGPEVLPAWATGRGCDVYQFDFASGRERKRTDVSSKRASEFLPTVSPALRIALARVYERRRGRAGRVPYLYAKRGRHSLRRVAGGPRGKSGLPGPTSLDLAGNRLAFTWDYSPKSQGLGKSELRLDRIGGRRQLLERKISGLVVRKLISPTTTRDAVFAGLDTAIESNTSVYLRYSNRRREPGSATAPAFLVSTSFEAVSGAAYYVRSGTITLGVVAPGRPPSCGAQPPAPAPGPASGPCVVARSDRLAFDR